MFDPTRLPRIQAIDQDLGQWLAYFDKNPGERFVSDGDPAVVTIPSGRRDRLKSSLASGLKVVER